MHARAGRMGEGAKADRNGRIGELRQDKMFDLGRASLFAGRLMWMMEDLRYCISTRWSSRVMKSEVFYRQYTFRHMQISISFLAPVLYPSLSFSSHLIPIALVPHGPVREVIEPGLRLQPIHVARRHPHERAREATMLGMPSALIRQDTRVVHTPYLLQLWLPLQRVAELQLLPPDAQRQPHLALLRNAHRLRERKLEPSRGVRRLGGHDEQLALAVSVRGDGQIEEVIAAVVRDEPRELTLVGGAEGHHRLRVVREVRLAPRDQRLLEPAADSLAPDQLQRAVDHVEDALRLGRAQPLEVPVQPRRGGEGVVLLGPVGRVVARGGQLDVQRGDRAVRDVQPVIGPVGFLDGALAAQDAPPQLRRGTARQMHEVGLTVGGVDDVCVAGALEGGERGVGGREDGVLRVDVVGAPDVAGARERHGVVVPGAALGREQIVVPIALV